MGFPEPCQHWDEGFFFKDDSNTDMGTIKYQRVKFHPESDYNGPTQRETSKALSAQTFSMRAKVGVSDLCLQHLKIEKSPTRETKNWYPIFQGRSGCFFSF